MSHFSTATIQIKDAEALVRALGELGLIPEVHAEPVALYGFLGDERPERAQIIVRRAQLSGLSNDIGFLRNADGTFTAILSDYDRRIGYGAAWLKKVTMLTGVHAAMRKAQTLGHRVERRVDEKGRTQLVVTGGRW